MPPPPRPQIEDASDSDSDSEPSEMDPADFPPALPPNDSNDDSSDLPALPPTKDLSAYAHYQCLYPVYFDALRTRRTGRRVSRALASPNPLAREIVDAVAALGLRTLFEPAKTHPKDWANPGRVKVLLRQQGSARIKNKHHLYRLVAEFLREHPATRETPLRLKVPGLGVGEGVGEVAVPRGWRMGSILPTHSPAVSGGGVSENFLRDMVGEMQRQGGGGQMGQAAGLLEQMGTLGVGGEKRKKEKRKVIRA